MASTVTRTERGARPSDHAHEPADQSPMERLIDLGLGLVLLVTPCLISTGVKDVFNTPKNAFLGFAAVAVTAALFVQVLRGRSLAVPRLSMGLFLGLAAVWMTLSVAFCGCPELAVRDLGYHLALLSVFFVAVCAVTSRERIDRLLHCAMAAGVIVSGYAMLQYHGLDGPLFDGLGRVLLGDPTRLSPSSGQVAGGLLGWLLPDDAARQIGAWLDPRVLILPGKPEEPSKNYSFMGHRNYLAGYLIALIPLVVSRLLIHVDLLMKRWPTAAPRGRWLLAMLRVLALLVLPASVLALAAPPLRPVAALSWAALVGLVLVLPAARPVVVYLATLVLMLATVLQTHTRGAWIGLALGISFLIVTVWWKEGGAGRWRGLGIRLLAIGFALLIKVVFVSSAASWIPLLVVVLELVVHHTVTGPTPRFLSPLALGLVMVPLAVVLVMFGWKSLDLAGVEIVNPLNREWVSAIDRIDDTFKCAVSTSTHQRWLIYRTALAIIFDSPRNCLVGTGPGTFGLHYMPYQARVLADAGNERLMPEANKSIFAHSEYLHYWSELGLVGLGLIFLAGLSLCRHLCRTLAGCRFDHDALRFIGIVAGVVAVLVHVAFSFCLHLPYTASLLCCLVAFSIRFYPCPVVELVPHRGPEPTRSPPSRSLWWGTAPLAAVLFALVAAAPVQRMLSVLTAEHHWREAHVMFRLQRFDEALVGYARALSHDPGRGEMLFDLGRALMDSGADREAVAAFESAAATFVDPATHHNVALCHYKQAVQCRERGLAARARRHLEEALEAYRRALALNPIYEQSLLNAAMLLADLARLDPARASARLVEAEALARRGARYHRGNTAMWAAYGEALALEGRLAESRLPLLRALARTVLDRRGRAPETGQEARSIPAVRLQAAWRLFDRATASHLSAQLASDLSPAERDRYRARALADYLKVVSVFDRAPGRDASETRLRQTLAHVFHEPGGQGVAKPHEAVAPHARTGYSAWHSQ
ncbi:MAG: O-antigen ligase family protein [Candidatus Riflebacteria bacterium]|nr:O-antigen ligase family protein [Candidatus Riflebacteria bacterium]